jgi:multisubunit Na+/H+ antiporter MnhG subunit
MNYSQFNTNAQSVAPVIMVLALLVGTYTQIFGSEKYAMCVFLIWIFLFITAPNIATYIAMCIGGCVIGVSVVTVLT